ncbi:MAG: VanW family protein [Candidatus Moraniibacteriota bacterium]
MKTKKYFFLLALFCLSFLQARPVFALENQPSLNPTNSKQLPLVITIEQYSEEIPPTTLSNWNLTQSSLSIAGNYKTEFENIDYCPTAKLFCDFTLKNSARQHFKLTTKKTINEKAVRTYLETLAKKVNSKPSDAKFSISDGKVTSFAEEKNGITLDIEKSFQTISTALNSALLPEKLSLDYSTSKPAISYGEVNNFGISSLIGEGTSNFKGSPANRIHNIKVATERYNGIMIKPGEEFSFVKFLGEVDGEHGYLPELVIKNNVTEPEFGGGICQVSTTAFRAAIYAGLKITARKNHAYPVSYYNPQGMDSTVYVPNPDLRFLNNTPGYILIQTKIVGTTLTFDFYGTDDGRKTTVDGPKITERQPDGALKATFSQTVLDKDGKEFIKDVFNSSYNSPYRYPHPGGPTLSVKPANWSEDEWKNYKKMLKDMASATAQNAKA